MLIELRSKIVMQEIVEWKIEGIMVDNRCGYITKSICRFSTN